MLGLSDMMRLDVSASAFLSDMVVDVFLPWLDVSVGRAFMTRSDISAEEGQPGG